MTVHKPTTKISRKRRLRKLEGAGGAAALEKEAVQCEPPLIRVPRDGRQGEKRRKLGGHSFGGLPDIPDRAPLRCSTLKALATAHVRAARHILSSISCSLSLSKRSCIVARHGFVRHCVEGCCWWRGLLAITRESAILRNAREKMLGHPM